MSNPENQEFIRNSILGKADQNGDRKGGFVSRLNAVYEVGGESIQDIPSDKRYLIKVLRNNFQLPY